MSVAFDKVKQDPNRLIIFDTTLRDGEQSPGCSMNLEEKLRMASLLDEMGVDVIEAGFPIASPGDFEAVQAIASTVKNATVCGLSRAKKGDIEASAEAIKPALKSLEMAAQIEMLKNRVPNIDQAILSVHCHNDLGLAVANSLAGIGAGARQAECTINGIGERAGNAALEEIIMALRTRADVMKYTNNVDTKAITKISKTLSAITGFTVQPNKAIVGANAFAHESGIHQDGMLKHAETYDDKKKEIFEDDLIALVEDEAVRENETIKFQSLQIVAGTDGPQTADLCVIMNDEKQCAKVEGNGPVDAIFKAIREICPHSDAHLKLYQVHAVTGGTDAQAEVTVRLEENGKIINGQGADADTLVASARAYINALNKLLDKRDTFNAQTGEEESA